MPHRRVSPLPVALLAIISLALGVFAAWTDADGDTPTTTTPKAAPAPATGPRAAPAAPPPTAPAPVPVALPACRPTADPPAAEPVPQDLLAAFGVLRRERADRDTLPDEALQALRARGLEPFDPAAARELRTTGDGGRAWVVPVRDAGVGPWERVCVRRRNRKLAPATRPTATKPVPGLAVVALGGAPSGGGGTLGDLVRGRAAVTADACSGPGSDMLTVSGIVPDGVAAAFLTAQDGTAVRADVQDNAYAFVVPRSTRPEQRYVVWTGGDGTPHVQPLLGRTLPAGVRCVAPPTSVPRVSPTPGGMCGVFGATVLPARPVAPPAVLVAPRVPRPTRAARRTLATPVPPRRRPVPIVVTSPGVVDCAPIAVPLPAVAPAPPRRTP